MSSMMPTSQTAAQQWGERREWPRDMHRYRSNHSGMPAGLMIAGLAALGLGALAAYYLGPDLIRYLKIERM